MPALAAARPLQPDFARLSPIHGLAGVSAVALLWGLGIGGNLTAHAAEPASTPVRVAVAHAEPTRSDDIQTSDLGEITVTARHRRESLQNVPLAITAVSGRELNEQHLDRVSDYAAKVPNFVAVQQNTRVSTLAIRGLGGNANNDGAESGVGLIVDNVFFTHVGFSWLDFVDLEGLEVVRGPQGTLLGKNTTIGAVIVRTQQPSFTPGFGVDATVASRDRYQARINLTGPIIADKLAVRLTLAKDQGGGWVTNAHDGQDYLDNNRLSVRGQLLFTPTQNISSRLIAEHYETREYNNFYPPIGDVNANLNLDGTVYSAIPDSWTKKIQNVIGYNPNFNAPNNADLDDQQRIVSRVDGLSNELNWGLGNLTLTSISAWRRLYFRPYNDADYTPAPIFRAGYDVDVDQYSQEFRLANAAGSAVDWQLGAYYLREDLSSNYRFILRERATAFFLGTNLLPSAILNGVETSKLGETKTESAAVFGQATWHATERFNLTAGLRYTHETKDASVLATTSGGAALPPTQAPYRAAIVNALSGIYSLSGSRTVDAVSWLINPSYKVNDNFLLYASASYGEKSGAANTTASATVPLFIEPEESHDFEVGFKSTWFDRRARLNVNLYNNEIENYQGSQYSPQLLTVYLANVGKVRLRGVEVETGWRPNAALGFTLSAAYNDATYLSYDNAPAPYEYQVSQQAKTGSRALSLTGYQLVGAPKVNAQFSVDYSHPIGRGLELFSYGNAAYRDKVSLNNPRSEIGWQAAYTLVNAGIGVRTADQRWSALLWSKNLFDEQYLVGVGAATTATPVIGIYGDPRTVGLTLSARF